MSKNELDLIRHLEILGYTVEEISRMIGVKKAMVYMVKRGERNLSCATHYILMLKYLMSFEFIREQPTARAIEILNKHVLESNMSNKSGLIYIPAPQRDADVDALFLKKAI